MIFLVDGVIDDGHSGAAVAEAIATAKVGSVGAGQADRFGGAGGAG